MRRARHRHLSFLLLQISLLYLCSNATESTERVSLVHSILDQVLTDLICSQRFQKDRDWYGTSGDKNVALLLESPTTWPTNWKPRVPGYCLHFRSDNEPRMDFLYWKVPGGVQVYSFLKHHDARRLGVRLDRFYLDQDPETGDQITVSMFNFGGNSGKDSKRVGAMHVSYAVKMDGQTAKVSYTGSFSQ